MALFLLLVSLLHTLSVQSIQCDYDGISYWEGDKWFDSNDTTCQTFCVCQSDGTVSYSSQYTDIPSNGVLATAFADHCWYDMPDSCLTDATRWVLTASSCACPNCGCPANLSDPTDPTFTWFEGWVDEQALASGTTSGNFIFDMSSDPYHCDICHCENGKTLCEDAVSAEWDISSHCTDTAITQCYKGDAPSNATDITTAVDITTAYCEPYRNYCGVMHSGSDFGDQSTTQYDCSEGFVCEVLGLTDGGCVMTQYNSTLYGMDFAADAVHCELKEYPAVPQLQYTSCCTGDYCNNYQLNPNDCVSDNAMYDEYAQKMFECQVGSQAFWRSFGFVIFSFAAAWGGDDDCAPDEAMFGVEPCNMIRDFFEAHILCPCGAVSILYNSEHATDAIKAEIVTYFEAEATGPDGMNVDMGCGLSFTCDLVTAIATLDDTDYTLAFDLEVGCYVSTCVDVNAYLLGVYETRNITVVPDNVVVTNCNVDATSNTLSAHVEITFGGSVVRDAVSGRMADNSLDWTPGCGATVSNSFTSESTTTETFDGPSTTAPVEPTATQTSEPTASQTSDPTTTQTYEPTAAQSSDPTTSQPSDPPTSQPSQPIQTSTTNTNHGLLYNTTQDTESECNTFDPTTSAPFCWGRSQCKMTKQRASGSLDICNVCSASLDSNRDYAWVCECKDVQTKLLALGEPLSVLGLTPSMERNIVYHCFDDCNMDVTIWNATVCGCSAVMCGDEIGRNPPNDTDTTTTRFDDTTTTRFGDTTTTRPGARDGSCGYNIGASVLIAFALHFFLCR